MLYLLLPAYNEGPEIRALLTDIINQEWAFPYRIIVVDDGSVDDTKNVAKSFEMALPIIVISHPQNRGLGRAMSTGLLSFNHSIANHDVLVTMDADHTHPVEMVPLLREKVLQGSGIVVASRFCPGGRQIGLSFFRRCLSRCAAIVSKALWSIPGIADYTSGYRAYSGKVIRKLFSDYEYPVSENGFAVTLELLLKTARQPASCAEVPLTLRYDRKQTNSKMKVLPTIADYCRLIAAIYLTKR
jgi:dolichol-phosphate mannosyltransferase